MNKFPKAINAEGNLLYQMPSGEMIYVGSSSLLKNYKKIMAQFDEGKDEAGKV